MDESGLGQQNLVRNTNLGLNDITMLNENPKEIRTEVWALRGVDIIRLGWGGEARAEESKKEHTVWSQENQACGDLEDAVSGEGVPPVSPAATEVTSEGK